jgi:hypothetical protein
MSEVDDVPSKGRALLNDLLHAWPIFAAIFGFIAVVFIAAGESYIDKRALEVHNAQPGPQDISQLVSDVQSAKQTAESNETAIERVEDKIDQLLLILTQRNLEGR